MTEGFLKKYPENDILLNNLLYVTPDADETIEIASKLTERAIEETEKALSLIPVLGHPNFEIYTEYFNKQIERMKNK